MANNKLTKARSEKNDEFYTRLEDIEKELKYYRKHFEGKVVFCNCDDPYESNFFKFFALNFNWFKLKKLMATCYDGSPISGIELPLWEEDGEEKKKALKAVLVIDELYDANGDGAIDEEDVKLMLQKPGAVTELKGNGSFDSPECIELLKESDIVCTNPPFSRFRDFIELILKYNKKFLIIGNTNATTYKEIFSKIKDNQIWLGVSSFNTGMYFYVPETYEYTSDYKSDKEKDGKKTIRVSSVCWFTNLEHPKRNEPLYLVKEYNGHEDEYPKYDNYDAIEVSKVENIPDDYKGVMGVPITFLDKYCPEQFEILGCCEPCIDLNIFKNMKNFTEYKSRQIVYNNHICQKTYHRILIRRK